MKTLLIFLFSLVSFSTFGQNDSLFIVQSKMIINGFNDGFKSFIKKDELSSFPNRLVIFPGLFGDNDDLYLRQDSIFIYAASNTNPLDSLGALDLISYIEEKLTNILGSEFKKSRSKPAFTEKVEVPIEFKSHTIHIYVQLGKFGNKGFLVMLVFTENKSKSPY